MKFFAVTLAAFAATASAMSYEQCTVVTITETVTAKPSTAPTLPPYPTGSAPYPIIPTGTGVPTVPSGTASPSGTGKYTPPPPYFTGAASNLQVGGALAGVGAFAAFFL